MSKNTPSLTTDEKKPENEHEYLWKKEQEDILQVWADKAKCFNVMHERAYKRFWCMNAWFNIPVIIISTITGTGNFASTSFGSNAVMYTFIIGGFNIFAGILATIGTYIGAAQKCEGHRFALIHWDKLGRKIQIELTKKRADRVNVKLFMKQLSEEYDRLIEMSPILPNDIIRWFSDIVDDDETQYTDCGICCHECFCFACGCNLCTSCLTKCSWDKLCGVKKCNKCKGEFKHQNTKSNWSDMALPEIIGKITRTSIAVVDVEVPKPVEEKEDNVNIYNIY